MSTKFTRHAYGHDFTTEELKEMGYPFSRRLDDGVWLAVAPMSISNGRLFVGLNQVGFDACYCYKSVAEACAAMAAFDPEKDDEPEGWIKDPNTNRCRPGGDKSKETIGWPKDY